LRRGPTPRPASASSSSPVGESCRRWPPTRGSCVRCSETSSTTRSSTHPTAATCASSSNNPRALSVSRSPIAGWASRLPSRTASSRSSTASTRTWPAASAAPDLASTSPESLSGASTAGSGSSRTSCADRSSTWRSRPPRNPRPRENRRKRLEPPLEKSVANRIRQIAPADETVGMTVLIVDDHPSFRASARTLLEAEGYEVVGEAENAVEALRSVRELKPDLVLLDVQLPDLDGFEVCERLRVFDHPPVVVLTSSRDGADYGRCIEGCGACGFVPKGDLSGAAIAALLSASA